MGDQSIAILTLKTGLLTLFFNEKRYGNFIIACINSNTSHIIPLWACSIPDFRCLNRKFATRCRVTSVQSLLSPPQINILLFAPKGIQNLLRIPNSRLLFSLGPFLSLLALLAGSVFFSNRETFWIERKLALTCLKTQIALQYKHQKQATSLIVTILTDISACNNNISNNNKR